MDPTPVRRFRWLTLAAFWFAAANPVAGAGSEAGYLAPSDRPDSVALLPSPPLPGSPEFAADEASYREFIPLAATPRWLLARQDGNLQFPAAVDAFACALGITVSQPQMPRLYLLLQRTVVDASQSTAAAKQKYQRQRPFEIAGDEICEPSEEALLRGNASYPSGHASVGYLWGEVLAAVAPERAAAVRERGLQFGISRAVCRLHWQSDIDAGRKVGAAVMLAVRDKPEFVADLEVARGEMARAGAATGPPPAQHCADEAAALALTPARPLAARKTPGPPPRIAAAVFARSPELWDPDLSPSGRQMLARATVRGRESVVVHDMESGTTRRVPLPAEAETLWYQWAGDSRILVALGWTQWVEGEELYVTRLVVVDLADLKARVLGDKASGPVGDDVLHVDPAGRWLLLALQESAFEYPAVFRYDLATGQREEVVKPVERVWDWYADGDGVVRAGVGYLNRSWFMLYRKSADAPFRRLPRVSYADAATGYEALTLVPGSDEGYLLSDEKTGRVALYRYNYATQQLGEVVHELPRNDVDDYATSRDGQRVLAVTYTDDRERVHWLDPAMREHQRQLDANFRGQAVQFVSRDEQRTRFLVWVGGANDPGSYYLYVPAEKSVRLVAHINSQIDPAQMAQTEYTSYTARDGLEIPAYLTLPVGRVARDLPLIVLPHGGPYFVRDVLGYDEEVQFLANRGYAVLQPNFRGSYGYGTDFAERGNGEWGRAMQDDLDDGVDWLARRGIVDAGRVCLVGSSYGGYAALWGVTRNPERYRCAASFAGVTDIARQLRYQSASLDGADRAEWQLTVKGERRFDLDALSPLQHAASLTRPVLLAHGEKDKTVLFRQTAAYRAALLKAGKPHEFKAYPEEGHGFEDPANLTDWLERLGAFLAQYNPAD